MDISPPITEERTDSRRIKPLVAGARLSPAEMRRLQLTAQASGQSVSGYLRNLILEATSSGV